MVPEVATKGTESSMNHPGTPGSSKDAKDAKNGSSSDSQEDSHATTNESIKPTLCNSSEEDWFKQLLNTEVLKEGLDGFLLHFDKSDNVSKSTIVPLLLRLTENLGLKRRPFSMSVNNLSVYGNKNEDSLIPNIFTNTLELVSLVTSLKPKEKPIVENFNAIVEPGELLLVLGKHCSGSTVLMNALAGLEFSSKITGSIMFDELPLKEMMQQFPGNLIYVEQEDNHIPFLTVEETLKFAIACKTPVFKNLDASRGQYIDLVAKVLATVFNIQHKYKRLVGNDPIRGLTNYDKNLLSIAEVIACRGYMYFWDNSTRCLSSKIALEVVKSLKSMSEVLKVTNIMCLNQASEDIYKSFDKVTVMAKGKQIYFGRIDKAKAYFENLGFYCPENQSTPEFLTAITKLETQLITPGFLPPKSPQEMEECWHNSKEYADLIQEINQHDAELTKEPLEERVSNEKAEYPISRSRYIHNYIEQVAFCVRRNAEIWVGNWHYIASLIVMAAANGLINGGINYDTPRDTHGIISRQGSLFFMATYFSLMGMAEVSSLFLIRPILKKQRNLSMYAPSAYAIGYSIVGIPISFTVVVVFGLCQYFIVGMTSNGGKFFTIMLFAFLVQYSMFIMFQAVASLNSSPSRANTWAGILGMLAIDFSAGTIPKPFERGSSSWLSFVDPMYFAIESMLTSEFHFANMTCDPMATVPNGPGYESPTVIGHQGCDWQGAMPGQTYVYGNNYIDAAYGYTFSHTWRNLGILIGYTVFFLGIFCLGCEYVYPTKRIIPGLIFKNKKKSRESITPAVTEKSLEIVQISHSLSDDDAVLPLRSPPVKAGFLELQSKDVLTWKNLNYYIQINEKQLPVLNDVSGYCIPGTMTAIMAKSQLQKTSILRILTGTMDVGFINCDILINGLPIDESYGRRIGYVSNDVIHVSQLTVRESLQFISRLKRPRSVPDSEKMAHVERIIKALKLTTYADAMVGTIGTSLNMDERRRFSIASELVGHPTLVLFLDEPTSGLDSQSSIEIVGLLRELAEAGHSILCSISQPSEMVFEMFDRLLLIGSSGRTTYFGDVGHHCSDVLNYFQCNGARKYGKHENPAEYIVDVLEDHTNGIDWAQVWSGSKEKKQLLAHLLRLTKECRNVEISPKDLAELKKPFATPYWYQLLQVTKRTSLMFYRDPMYFQSKFLFMIITGLMLGFTFYGLLYDKIGVQNAEFAATTVCIFSTPLIIQILGKAIENRTVYESSERRTRSYHWSTIILAQIINELPYLFVIGAIQFATIYLPMVANREKPNPGAFYVTSGLFMQAFHLTYSYLIFFPCPNIAISALITTFIYTIFILNCGVQGPTPSSPGFFKSVIYKINPMNYLVQNMASSLIGGVRLTCTPYSYVKFPPPDGTTCGDYMATYLEGFGGYLDDSSNTEMCMYCPYNNTSQMLGAVNMKASHIWRNIGFLCAFIVFNVFASMFLYWIIRLRKRPILSYLKLRRRE